MYLKAASTVCSFQLGMSSTAVLNLLHTMDIPDTGNFAEILLQTGEMSKVDGFDDEVHMHRSVRGGARFHTADVGAIFGDNRCELLEQSRAIVDSEGQLDGICRLLRASGVFATALCFGPLNVDPAVCLIEKVLDIGTASRVDGDTFATRDVANDLFAADRIATSRSIDEEIVLSFDLK